MRRHHHDTSLRYHGKGRHSPLHLIDGNPVDVGYGGGLNPRTAIGQRADGTVLLLVIDGRQPSSIGASYNDLIGIFMEYGAVNAYNLDGGNSAMLMTGQSKLNYNPTTRELSDIIYFASAWPGK